MTEAGVGTNRYAYSANDPVNLMDPEGNETVISVKPDPDGNEGEEQGKIDVEVTVAWASEEDKKRSPYSEAEIAKAVKTAFRRTVLGLVVKGKSGTYAVNFNVSFVDKSKTSYSITVTEDGTGAAVNGSKNGTKTMNVDITDFISVYAHEAGH